MIHKEFFGLLFLAFVAWIFTAAPAQRLENACAPVGWVGNGTTSLSSLVLPAQQQKVQGWFDKVEYGCEYVAWRLFYQKAYNQFMATQGLNVDNKGAAPAAASGAIASSGTPPVAASTPAAAAANAASAGVVPAPVRK
ncbi:hypothetical protein [Burkholderia cenocepacia]|uniref:hypothetical protein n=1 Tax=Burkholderia cenocepacia TaxID=95486 RepID=UPI0007617AB7|nr:hypothetical protein [Burkholderia cenocepacia]KWU17808.1 hypothetical protein AS149_13895 [Burkholderia cenocepacia]